MKRYLVLAIVIVMVASLLVGCSKDEKKPESNEPPKVETGSFYVTPNKNVRDFDIDLGNGLHITSAVTISGNQGIYLGEKEYKALVKDPEERIGGDTALEEGFVIDTYETYYDLEKIKRVIPLFDDAEMIYAPESLEICSEILDKGNFKITGEMVLTMDRALVVGYDLLNQTQTMTTGGDPDMGFAISPKYKYAATAFIPKLAEVKGFFTGTGDDHKRVTALYPCVMKNGYMDGIYVVLQSDSTDAFPELG